MKQVVLLPILIFLFINCQAQVAVGYSFKNNEGVPVDSYYIVIPPGHSYQIVRNQHSETKLFRYSDSCFIFVSNSHYGGEIFRDISKVYGNNSTKYLSSDTITLFGIDKKGHYWEQKKYKSFLVGYFRVPFNKLDYYHEIISNVNIKKLPLLE